VQANESLSFDFADEPEPWGGPGFDPGTAQSHHHAFHVSGHVSEAEFDAIFGRVTAPRGFPTAAAGLGAGSTLRICTAASWRS
jgi:hypothetical protein